MALPGALKKYAVRKAAAVKKRGPRKGNKSKPKAKRAPRSSGTGHQKSTFISEPLGGQTQSLVRLSAGKPDSRAYIMKAVVPPNHRTFTSSSYVTTSLLAGRQAWGNTTLAGQSQLQGIATQLSQTGTNIVDPARYLLENVKHTVNISNFSQSPCKLFIYHIKTKRDTYDSMNFTSSSGLVYPWQGGPQTAIQMGIACTSGEAPSPSPVLYLVPNILPTESPIFNKYFEIQKETQIMMSQGATHLLTTNKRFDRVMDASVYGNTDMFALQGITEFVLYRAVGVTGYDAANPSVNTLSAVQIGLYETFEFTFRQVLQATQTAQILDTVGATASVLQVQSAATGGGSAAVGLNPSI